MFMGGPGGQGYHAKWLGAQNLAFWKGLPGPGRPDHQKSKMTGRANDPGEDPFLEVMAGLMNNRDFTFENP